MKKESLTRKFLAEMLNPESGNGTYEPTRTKRKENRPGKSTREEIEQKLRRSINFGSGFYSIAEAAIVTNRSKNAIRQMIKEGRLTKLAFPNTSREFISGIELTDVIVQHNIEKILSKKD